MILPLVILYVVTLVYLSITERFRNFASLIGLQGWLLFAIALVRLHAINPAELAFIKMGTWLKTAAFSLLAADAVAAAFCPRWWIAAPLAVLLTGLSVGVVESTQARNKLSRNTTFILTIAALAALVFFTGYLLQLNIGLQ